MPGILDSGSRFLLELSNVAFNEILVQYLRERSIVTCAQPNGLWIEDAGVYGNARQVSLVQVSGNPPQQNIDNPLPPIPFSELETGTHKYVFFFEAWPFLRAFHTFPTRLTTVAGAMAVGFPTGNNDRATFDAFETNTLSSYGTPHEFAITCFVDNLVNVLKDGFSSAVFTTPIGSVPFLVGPEPDINRLQVSSDGSEPAPNFVNSTISLAAEVELTIGSDTTTLVAPMFVSLELGIEPGSVLARVRVPPELIDPDLIDESIIFGTFSQAERNATSAKLTFAFVRGIVNRFSLGGFLGENAPDPVEFVRLGEATVRLMDERYSHRHDGFGPEFRHPRLSCDGWQVDGETLTLFGRILRELSGAPHLVLSPAIAEFVETRESGCAQADPPTFERVDIELRNDGSGPLYICPSKITITGTNAAHFSSDLPRVRNDYRDIEIPAGSKQKLRLHYTGPRMAALAVMNIPTNDRAQPLAKIPLRVRPSAYTQISVLPAALFIERANNPMGAPVLRIENCRPVPVRQSAAQFTVTNTGSNVLNICSLELDYPPHPIDEPQDFFGITFVPRTLRHGETAYFGVDFYPKEAGQTYRVTCRLGFSAGQSYDLPIEARVEILPQPGEPGDWIDIAAGHACVGLDHLCMARGYFEPVRDAAILPLVEMTVAGLPGDAELVMRDGNGRTHLHDRSGRPDRRHALEFTPNPDGGPMPGDPCLGEIPGYGPAGSGPFGVDIEGWLIEPDADVLPVDRPDDARFVGGFVYAPDGDGIAIVGAGASRMHATTGGRAVEGVAIGRDRMALATGGRLLVHDATPGRIEAPSAELQLQKPVRHLALIGTRIAAAHDDAVSIYGEIGGRLGILGEAALGSRIAAIEATRDGLAVLTRDNLILLDTGREGTPRIISSIAVPTAANALTRERGVLIVHAGAAAQAFGLVAGRLRLLADYPLGHWSGAFLPGRHDGVLYRRVGKDGLQRCRVRRHEFSRRRFAKAFELQYRPERPKRDAETSSARPSPRAAPSA